MRLSGWALALAAMALGTTGCVYCPWMAKAGDVAECEGSVLDNIDGRAYRLTLTEQGASRTHSATLDIQRDDCSIRPPQDLTPMGVERLLIKNPRSAKTASVVIETELRNKQGEPITCSAPLVEFETLDFICLPQAKGRRYLLEPLE